MKIFKRNVKRPIWLMRQAGRYLPEYREIRKSTKSFLDLCYNPEKACEVTLQPIKRFGFDASIIFSDILVLPNIFGWDVRFEDNIGPILRPFRIEEDFRFLKELPDQNAQQVYYAINKVRSELPQDVSLIGFVGAPWTVASYMIEGKSSKDLFFSRRMIYSDPILFGKLIDFITEKSIFHLKNQIKAGADVVQIFDSFAGFLGEPEYSEYIIKPTKLIVSSLKKDFPNIPIIGFPKGSGLLYEKYAKETGIDVLSLDWSIDPSYAKGAFQGKVLQGNLDPATLASNKETIERKARYILEELSGRDLIFNLGHGVTPESSLENVEFLVNYVRNFNE